MTTKKATPKRKGGKAPAQLSPAHAADIKRLAVDLANVLTNPALPRGLYNNIKRAMCELGEPDAVTNSASYLAELFTHLSARKAGAQ
ncbi:MAG: hypothetical protein ACJ74W_01370 [Pyrinomonadaceae bacterium]